MLNGNRLGTRTLSTDALVGRLAGIAYHVSRESLWRDVHRGLLSPLMPSAATPGSGTAAQWSPMAARRVLYMARLRRRGVNGHVLPLLLWLRDGWGWSRILPSIQAAMRKSAAMDHAFMNKPARVRTMKDLMDNAEQDGEWQELPDRHAALALRKWAWSLVWSGEPASGATPEPMLLRTIAALTREITGEELSERDTAEYSPEIRAQMQARRAMKLSASAVADWLAGLDAMAIEQGRRYFNHAARVFRMAGREASKQKGEPRRTTSFLTLGGKGPNEIAADCRASPGRLTPAQILALCIAQAMLSCRVKEVATSGLTHL